MTLTQFSASFRFRQHFAGRGRCNREGKDDKGYVYVFDIDETYRKGSDLAMRINKTKGLLEKYQDITSYDCIKEYYDGIFDFNQMSYS